MRYRYTKANGQHLSSQFENPVEAASASMFQADQAYDLNVDFISGSASEANSFVSNTKLTGYTAKDSLIAWWRLGKYNNSSLTQISDESKNSYHLTGAAGSTLPSLDSGDTPSLNISRNSFLFDGTDDVITNSLSDIRWATSAGGDKELSVSLWFKTSAMAAEQGLICASGADNAYEWSLSLTVAGLLKVMLYDGAAYIAATTTSPLSVDTWYNVCFTYDASATTDGINIYVDGTAVAKSGASSGTYTTMGISAPTTMVLGALEAAGFSNYLTGNITDVAIWSKELAATEASNLYGVKLGGAYRNVRDYELVSTDNDTRLIGTATGQKGFDTTSLPGDILNQYQQGKDVKTFDQLLNYNALRVRSNSDFVLLFNEREVSDAYFDESIATTSLTSGSNISRVMIGGDGRFTHRIDHEIEKRDLGQSTLYDNSIPYEDTLDSDPIAIVSKHPSLLVLPSQIVLQTSDELMDGVIEPLTIREIIDNSSIESPFNAHTFRASAGDLDDAFRRSSFICDGKDLDENTKGCAPFLDTVESFGGVAIPGQFSDDIAHITPYVEYVNDVDKEYTINSIESGISAVMIASSSFKDSDTRKYDKMASRGFTFVNCEAGIDSIAYGGLKK